MTTLANRPNSALLVVDMQNGVVGEAHDRDSIVANIKTLLDKARAADVDVVWVQHNSEELPHGSESWQLCARARAPRWGGVGAEGLWRRIRRTTSNRCSPRTASASSFWPVPKLTSASVRHSTAPWSGL